MEKIKTNSNIKIETEKTKNTSKQKIIKNSIQKVSSHYLSNMELIKKLTNKKLKKKPKTMSKKVAKIKFSGKNSNLENKNKSENFLKTIKTINRKLDLINKKNNIKKILALNTIRKSQTRKSCSLANEKMSGYMNYPKIDITVKNIQKKILKEPTSLFNLMDVIKKYAFHNKMFLNDINKI